MKSTLIRWGAVFPIFAFAALSHAGTVITTNLPSNTWIMNIDGRSEGASNFDGGQANWWTPFASNGQFAELTLGPGTYTFQLINPTDAAAKYPSLDSTQISEIYTAWSYNSPFVTDYIMYDKNANNTVDGSALFYGAVTGNIPNWQSYPGANSGGFNTAQDAYNAAITGGVSDQIVTGPLGRFSGVKASSYTFAQTTTIIGAIPDYYVGDNQAGVSIVVSSVPEPMSLLTLSGLILLVSKRNRKRN